jgi:hypothetical protein
VGIAICPADEIVPEDLGGNTMGQTESSLENQRQAFPRRLTWFSEQMRSYRKYSTSMTME